MNKEAISLTTAEKKLIFYLSGDLGPGLKPYEELAQKIGWTEDEVLSAIKRFNEQGLIRRFGVTLWHQRSGFVANAMTVWQVKESEAQRAGEALAALPYVSHCYLRAVAPIWPYNLYAMIHAQSRPRLLAMVDEMKALISFEQFKILESVKELKKTSLRYFS